MIARALDKVRSDLPTQIVLALIVVYSTTYWIPGCPLPDWMPWGVVAQGVIFGTSYALTAMGLILIYRTTRIVNFAYGAMGAMPGALTVGLFTAKGWNYWVAISVGVAVGIVSGALIDILVIRRFARSSRLVLTVATIGLAQVLGAIGLIIVLALEAEQLIGDIQTPLSGGFSIRPYPIRGDHLLMIGVAPVILGGLGWFLLGTDAGRAVRAAAENQDRALLLGVPVRRLQTLVWAIAGGLATVTFVTKAPFTGVVPTVLIGATSILPGLAVAVIARFQSLPTALVGGLGLGIAEWTIRWNTTAVSVFDVTFLIVILVVLLTRRDRSTRADTGETTWDAAGVLKPVPAALHKLPEVRWPRWGLAAAGAAIVVLVPLAMTPSTVTTLSFALVWGLIAVSLVVLTGWGGNISLGQFGIVGLSAMAAGNLVTRWNVDLFLALAAAMVAGAVVAILIGLPALRIRGLYLAVTTIAFAVALDSYFLNPVNFDSFVPDNSIPPVLFKRFDMESQWVRYYFCLGALLVAVLLVRALRRTRPGRVMIATARQRARRRRDGRADDADQAPDLRVLGRAGRSGRGPLRGGARSRRRGPGHLPTRLLHRGLLVRRHRRAHLDRRRHLRCRVLPAARLPAGQGAVGQRRDDRAGQPLGHRPPVHPVLPPRGPVAVRPAPARPVPAAGGRSPRARGAEPGRRPARHLRSRRGRG